jgi:hypothetical protein
MRPTGRISIEAPILSNHLSDRHRRGGGPRRYINQLHHQFHRSAQVPTAGSFTRDSTDQTFAAFTVTWDGFVFYLAGNQQQDGNTSGCGLPDTQNSIFLLLTTPGGFCGPGQAGPEWMADAASNGDVIGFFDTDETDTSTIFDITGEVIGGEQAQNLNGVFSGGFSTAIAPTAATPEPSSFWLILAGGAMLLAGKYRRPAKAAAGASK